MRGGGERWVFLVFLFPLGFDMGDFLQSPRFLGVFGRGSVVILFGFFLVLLLFWWLVSRHSWLY